MAVSVISQMESILVQIFRISLMISMVQIQIIHGQIDFYRSIKQNFRQPWSISPSARCKRIK